MISTVYPPVWRWRDGAAVATAPDAGLRRRAIIQTCFPVALAAVFWWRGRPVAPFVLLAIGALLLVTGLFIPAAFRKIEHFGQALGRGVGAGLTFLLLVPFFYLVFLPGRLVLLAMRRDPMQRGFPSRETTFWTPYASARTPEDYGRQF